LYAVRSLGDEAFKQVLYPVVHFEGCEILRKPALVIINPHVRLPDQFSGILGMEMNCRAAQEKEKKFRHGKCFSIEQPMIGKFTPKQPA
jgi:hypothetical protein